MMCSVSPKSFMKYSNKSVKKYLSDYSAACFAKRPRINIMKVSICPINGTYRVIIKTHWLRLVQRRWKKVYAQRCEMMDQIKTPQSVMRFSMYGKSRLSCVPGLRGMMSMYRGGGASLVECQQIKKLVNID